MRWTSKGGQGSFTTRGILACAASLVALAVWPGDARPTTPGSNGLIVYAKLVGGGYQLFTARADGSRETRITQLKGSATEPDWSPDGRKIVFQLELPAGAGCHVQLVNADGSGLVDLTGDRNGCEGQPAFTADGRRIVFGRYDDKLQFESIWSMNLRGGDRRPITPRKGFGPVDPNVSPNGKWVTYVHGKKDPALTGLFAVRPNGSRLHQVVPHSWGVALKHDWSPDGKLILLTRNAHHARPRESANLVTIRPDGSGTKQLTAFEGGTDNAFAGSFSPDGKRIVFRLEKNGKYALAVIDRDGGNLRLLTKLSAARPRFIDWGARP